MSNLATVLDAGVVYANDLFDQMETRLPENGIINLFKRDTDLIVPKRQMEALKTSMRRDVDIVVMKVSDFNVLDKRAVNPARDKVETDRVHTNWFTKGFAFYYTPASNHDNYFTEAQEVGRGFFNGWRSVYFGDTDGLEATLAEFLEANKWASLPETTVTGVDVNAGAYELLTKDYIIKTPAVMRTLMIYNQLYDVANVGSWARERADSMYGNNNDHNKKQFLNDMMTFWSHNLPVTEDRDETHFVMPRGSVGLLNIVENDAAANRAGDDGRFYTIVDPWFGFTWGVRFSRVAQDQSGVYGDGFERALQMRVDVFADFSPILAYTSRAGESPIVKFNTLPA